MIEFAKKLNDFTSEVMPFFRTLVVTEALLSGTVISDNAFFRILSIYSQLCGLVWKCWCAVDTIDRTTPAQLARMAAEQQQKDALGDRLIARISEFSYAVPYAAKVTGILLERDVTEILALLERPGFLKSEVDVEVAVIKVFISTFPSIELSQI